jgi:hypothetical protein
MIVLLMRLRMQSVCVGRRVWVFVVVLLQSQVGGLVFGLDLDFVGQIVPMDLELFLGSFVLVHSKLDFEVHWR